MHAKIQPMIQGIYRLLRLLNPNFTLTITMPKPLLNGVETRTQSTFTYTYLQWTIKIMKKKQIKFKSSCAQGGESNMEWESIPSFSSLSHVFPLQVGHGWRSPHQCGLLLGFWACAMHGGSLGSPMWAPTSFVGSICNKPIIQ